MKKILLFAAVLGLAAFVSCKDNVGGESKLEVSPSSLDAAYEGEEVSFNIESNIDWVITTENGADWFEISSADLSGNGNKTIVVDVQANSDDQPRQARITVAAKAGDVREKTVTLTQSSYEDPFLNALNLPTLTVGYEAGDITFDIVSNVSWEISEPSVDWITNISPMRGTGDETITVTLTENPDETKERSFDLVITGSDNLSDNLNITQRANGYGPVKFEDLLGKYTVTGTPYGLGGRPGPGEFEIKIDKEGFNEQYNPDGNVYRVHFWGGGDVDGADVPFLLRFESNGGLTILTNVKVSEDTSKSPVMHGFFTAFYHDTEARVPVFANEAYAVWNQVAETIDFSQPQLDGHDVMLGVIGMDKQVDQGPTKFARFTDWYFNAVAVKTE